MDKKGKMNNLWPIVVLVIALGVLFYPNISNMIGGNGADDGGDTGDTVTVCPIEDTTLGFSAADVDDSGTEVALMARYWIEGRPKGEINTSSTTTVSPDDTLEVWFGSSSSTYYGSLFNSESTVPCKGTYDVAGKLWTEDESVSMTVYDEDDNPQSGAAYNQTLGIGEQVEMKLRVKGNFEKYYGNPEVDLDNILIIEYDKSEIDSVKVTLDGVELDSAAVPLAEALGAVTNSEIGFLMPKISGSNAVDYNLIIKADDVENPSTDMTVKIMDADYFYNSETGKIEEGWEDENDSDIGAATEPSATVYIS